MTQPAVTPGAPTQVRFSARAVVRTFLQAIVPAALALGVIVPEVVRVILESAGQAMPAALRGVLLGISTVVAATAAALARIMAIPRVEAFLRSSRFLKWLAAEPTPVPPTDVEPSTTSTPPGGYLGRMDAKHDAAHHKGDI